MVVRGSLPVASDKRVCSPLLAECSSWAMAGDEAHLIPQREELSADASFKRRGVAARKVGSPNRADKEQIANKHQRHLRLVEGKMPWCVAWHMEYLEDKVAYRDVLPIVEPGFGGKSTGRGKPKHLRLLR